MARVVVDATELNTFAATLDAAGPAVTRQTRAVITKGALNIKSQLRAEASRSRHFGQIAPTITFDVETTPGGAQAEIGPNRHYRAARLGNIAYFGTSRGGGTLPDPEGALNAEAPNVEKYLLDLAEDQL